MTRSKRVMSGSWTRSIAVSWEGFTRGKPIHKFPDHCFVHVVGAVIGIGIRDSPLRIEADLTTRNIDVPIAPIMLGVESHRFKVPVATNRGEAWVVSLA